MPRFRKIAVTGFAAASLLGGTASAAVPAVAPAAPVVAMHYHGDPPQVLAGADMHFHA